MSNKSVLQSNNIELQRILEMTNEALSAGCVKSVQRGVVTISSSTTLMSIAIEPVDTEKSVAYITGMHSYRDNGHSASSPCAGHMPYLEFYDSGTVHLKKTQVGGDPKADIPYEVVEFDNVKSIQRGLIKFTGNSVSQMTFEVEEVDPNKTMLFSHWIFDPPPTGEGYTSSGNLLGCLVASVTLEDSKTLKLQKALANGGVYGNSGGYMQYQLVEFK